MPVQEFWLKSCLLFYYRIFYPKKQSLKSQNLFILLFSSLSLRRWENVINEIHSEREKWYFIFSDVFNENEKMKLNFSENQRNWFLKDFWFSEEMISKLFNVSCLFYKFNGRLEFWSIIYDSIINYKGIFWFLFINL